VRIKRELDVSSSDYDVCMKDRRNPS